MHGNGLNPGPPDINFINLELTIKPNQHINTINLYVFITTLNKISYKKINGTRYPYTVNYSTIIYKKEKKEKYNNILVRMKKNTREF
jgi:hypothetical protein